MKSPPVKVSVSVYANLDGKYRTEPTPADRSKLRKVILPSGESILATFGQAIWANPPPLEKFHVSQKQLKKIRAEKSRVAPSFIPPQIAADRWYGYSEWLELKKLFPSEK